MASFSPRVLGYVLPLLILLQACTPAPFHELSSSEKASDLEWIFSELDQNYAPLDYKARLYHWDGHTHPDWENTKQAYRHDAPLTHSNEEFYALVFKLISEFKDPHLTALVTPSDAPGRTKVAHLGFTGKRSGKGLRVDRILPTSEDSGYPIHLDDVIVKLDGRTLADIAREQFFGYRDTGQDESNLTVHLPEIFNRISLLQPLPMKAGDPATLTVLRNEQTLEISVRWSVEDAADFKRTQFAAARAQVTVDRAGPENDSEDDPSGPGAAPGAPKLGLSAAAHSRAGHRPSGASRTRSFVAALAKPAAFSPSDPWSSFDPASPVAFFSANKELIPLQIKNLGWGVQNRFGTQRWNNFSFLDLSPRWVMDTLTQEMETPQVSGNSLDDAVRQLRKLRVVPESALLVNSAKIFPAMMIPVTLEDTKTHAISMKHVGYILLDTFFLDIPEGQVLQEFKDTLNAFQAHGVHDLIIDTIDNPGGSITLGMSLAQLLSNRKLKLPTVQFSANESHLEEFRTLSTLPHAPDSVHAGASKVFRAIEDAMKQADPKKRRLTETLAGEDILEYPPQPNSELQSNFKIALLVNEMCVSMCDTFAAIIQDNQLGKIIGAQTMGGGGSVETVQSISPASHFTMQMTAAILKRSNGEYIENRGIRPDIPFAVIDDEANHYQATSARAVDYLMTGK